MRARLPRPLGPGDRIGVVAPSGPVRAAAFDAGLERLRARGFVPVSGAHVRGRQAYLAGSDDDRLADLQGAISDRDVRAVWMARGGYGLGRLVARLDLSPLRRDPKPIIGYSDATVLHSAAWRAARLATYYGPNVSELGDEEAYDGESLWRALAGDPVRDYAFAPAQVVRRGSGEGPVVGGCLALIASLAGTPFAVRTAGAILFWEDVNEEPFRLDRMLGQLRLAGALAGLRGMIVGRLTGCAAADPANERALASILKDHLAGTRFPVVVDFTAGHVAGKVTVPLGRDARLDTRARRLRISGR